MLKKIALVLISLCVILPTAFANGSTEGSSSDDVFTWWDHYETFTDIVNGMLDEYSAESGREVEYTLSSPDKMSDSLLVAFRTNQMPDVMSLPFSDMTSVCTMFAEGWFQPLSVEFEDLPQVAKDAMFEGITMYDGEVYSVPIFSQSHTALFFYHPSMVSEAPTSWEELYNSCKQVYEESNGETYGLVLPMTFTKRMKETIEQLMDAAGEPVIDYSTGEYNYDSDAMMEFFYWMTRMWDEGLIHPSSVNFNMKQARERWAVGEAAYLIDGIYNVGITKKNFDPELSDIAVCEPVSADGQPYMIYKWPMVGGYYISKNCDNVEVATDMILSMIEDDIMLEMANVQDNPPVNTSVIADADVHETYLQSCDIFNRTIGLKPFPVAKNPDAEKVYAEMKTISPSPIEILNGYFSGAITDWEAALHEYNDKMIAERDRAIEKVRSNGYDVSLDDWVFPNFAYGESYTADKYQEL